MRFLHQHGAEYLFFILLLWVYSPHQTLGNDVRHTRGTFAINITHIRAVKTSRTLTSITPLPGFPMSSTLDLSFLDLDKVESSIFDHFRKLKRLNLSNNKFLDLPPLLFSKLRNLESLSLANNTIRRLDRVFVGLRHLKHLDLSNNKIEVLRRSDLLGLSKSAEIKMAGNPLKWLTVKLHDPSPLSPAALNPWTNRSSFDTTDIAYSYLVDHPNDANRHFLTPTFQKFAAQPFYVKLCQQNGVAESLTTAPENEPPGNCSRIDVNVQSLTLYLTFRGLKRFQKGWYQVPGFFTRLDLGGNEITEIEPELLNDLPESLTLVNLRKNRIKIIRRNVIENRFLRVLMLEENLISSIEAGAFEKTNLFSIDATQNLLTSLDFVESLPETMKELNLPFNRIRGIPGNAFARLGALQNLNLMSNSISALFPGAFRGAHDLRHLDLSNNSLETIEPGIFALKKLSRLELSSNRIKELKPGVFRGLKSIEAVFLSHNRIRKIGRNAFAGLKKSVMFNLHLDDNEIDAVEEGSFANMTIQHLNLNGNRISEDSVAKGAFKGCTVSQILLDRNLFGSINGNGFSGIRVRGLLSLRNNRVKIVGRGVGKYLGCVPGLVLDGNGVERIENGAFSGFRRAPMCRQVTVMLHGSVGVIMGGIFGDN